MLVETSKDAIAQAIRLRNGLANENNITIHEEELDIARKLSFSAALNGWHDRNEPPKVQIVIRLRPLATDDGKDTKQDECFRVDSDTALIAHPPKTSQAYRSTGTAMSFQFSRIFPPTTAQFELFESTTKPVLEAAFAGKTGLVFAYGVTNSGKTYTISGTDDQPGVLPRALKFVMAEMTRRKENDPNPVTGITASYLEIYNENVYDLLTTPVRKRRALRLQDCDGKIQVRGMTEKVITSLKEGEDLLAIGKKNKQVAETNCNMDSSRSHCVFTLHFYEQSNTRSGKVLRSKVSIVDLAGSERGAKSGASGLRMQEASKINGSLMNLMRCLETLRWNQQHPPALQKMVPFRESKLTRIFQENLAGKQTGPLVMIVAVNPSSYEFDETLRTLKYSAMARELVPIQTRSCVRKSTMTTTFYDLDGRLKKKKRMSSELNNAAPDAHQTAEVCPNCGQSRVLVASERKKRVPPSSSRRPKPPRAPLSAQKQKDTEPNVARENQVAMENEELREQLARRMAEIEDLRKQLSLSALENEELGKQLTRGVLENEELRMQLSQVNAESLEREVLIRQEIGNEMREQLQQIKAQYHSLAQRQQRNEDLPSAQKLERTRLVERETFQAEIRLLQAQLRESEDEIRRIEARQRCTQCDDPIKKEEIIE